MARRAPFLSRAITGNVDLARERATMAQTLGAVLAAEGQFDFVLTGDGVFTRRFPPPIPVNQASGLTQSLTALTESLTADLALARPDLGPPLRAYLESRLSGGATRPG